MASESDHEDITIINFMVLQPKELRILDLFHILFSRDIQKRKFVDCPESNKENLERRCLIFFSVLAQKSLLSVAKPMSSFGSKIEHWLNLLSCNRNFGVLLLNFLLGRVKKPNKTSASFLSIIGHLDKRVELDKSIKHGDSRYYPALSAMASKIVYENEAFVTTTVKDHWKMELVGYYNCRNDFQEKKITTQAFMLHDKNANSDMIVLAFRGTEPFDAYAWCTDMDISWMEIPDKGKIHGGFMKALGLPKHATYPETKLVWPKKNQDDQPAPLAYYAIREKLREIFQTNNRTKFIVTGHSLGGALAILFPLILALHEEEELLKRMEGVYTFGQPRVGDENFVRFMESQFEKYGIKYLRFVYGYDVVPRLPTDDKTFLFKHFGTCIYYDSSYKGKILSEEPNKNYFSRRATIAKQARAVWELLRSFIIPYTRGPDYKEGFSLIALRILGLIFPGLSAHVSQDYVNATRLGSIPLDSKNQGIDSSDSVSIN